VDDGDGDYDDNNNNNNNRSLTTTAKLPSTKYITEVLHSAQKSQNCIHLYGRVSNLWY
jgi:hypothetical protein